MANLTKFLALFLFSSLISSLVFSSPVYAEFNLPTFPSCPSGNSNVIADFSSGDHAVVGVQNLQSGSDKVFSVGDNNFTQCFCPSSGSGTQTDWLAAGNISTEDRNNLITQGWVLIPNGADWGLDSQPYLTKNSSFDCNGTTSGGTDSGGSGGVGGTSTNNQGGGQIEGISVSPSPAIMGEVLGISALGGTSSTNTTLQLSLYWFLGLLFIAYGISIKKRN